MGGFVLPYSYPWQNEPMDPCTDTTFVFLPCMLLWRAPLQIMVKLELNLPWKPILAWPWGVKYTVDPDTFCIVNHQETWDIDPLEGVKQIFRKPTRRL
jgi:hypothetical protein